jgi:hypothetical protein
MYYRRSVSEGEMHDEIPGRLNKIKLLEYKPPL